MRRDGWGRGIAKMVYLETIRLTDPTAGEKTGTDVCAWFSLLNIAASALTARI